MMFNPVQLIAKKRDGFEYSGDEIRQLIGGYLEGSVADYQVAAWAMAVYLQGMTTQETAALTETMRDSGKVMAWQDLPGPVVDKHSTGGIGDKVSLILAPLLACSGFYVPMISGRGLGPTGGTLDKLEAISGFRTDLTIEEVQQKTREVGCVITGASAEIAPADKRLYALRDVTATVPSIPLITASILSKKLAEGLDTLVMDVKCGNGAFMKDAAAARTLAQSLVETGEAMGVTTRAVLSNMNQPLGRFAGNAVEVLEAIQTLQGKGPDDLVELTLQLYGELSVACGRAESMELAMTTGRQLLDDGTAFEAWEKMVRTQGGDLSLPLRIAPQREIVASQSGYITRINTEQLGWEIIELGGGRKQIDDHVDHSVGLRVDVAVGDQVQVGTPLLHVYSNNDDPQIDDRLRSCFVLSDDPCPAERILVKG